MRLIDDDEIRAGPQEIMAPPIALNVVEADNPEGMDVKNALARRQIALKPAGAGAGHGHGVDVELRGQLLDPLVHQMRRAEHRTSIDLAAVEQLARNQSPLDGLSDPDVVCDQESHRLKLERHQERHKLVGTRLEADAAGATKRSSPTPEREQQSILQQQGIGLGAETLRRRCPESGRHDPILLQGRIKHLNVGLGARQWAQP